MALVDPERADRRHHLLGTVGGRPGGVERRPREVGVVEGEADACDVHRLQLAHRALGQGHDVGPVGVADPGETGRAGQERVSPTDEHELTGGGRPGDRRAEPRHRAEALQGSGRGEQLGRRRRRDRRSTLAEHRTSGGQVGHHHAVVLAQHRLAQEGPHGGRHPGGVDGDRRPVFATTGATPEAGSLSPSGGATADGSVRGSAGPQPNQRSPRSSSRLTSASASSVSTTISARNRTGQRRLSATAGSLRCAVPAKVLRD